MKKGKPFKISFSIDAFNRLKSNGHGYYSHRVSKFFGYPFWVDVNQTEFYKIIKGDSNGKSDQAQ